MHCTVNTRHNKPSSMGKVLLSLSSETEHKFFLVFFLGHIKIIYKQSITIPHDFLVERLQKHFTALRERHVNCLERFAKLSHLSDCFFLMKTLSFSFFHSNCKMCMLQVSENRIERPEPKRTFTAACNAAAADCHAQCLFWTCNDYKKAIIFALYFICCHAGLTEHLYAYIYIYICIVQYIVWYKRGMDFRRAF